MMDIRSIRRKARRDLHNALRVPAVYIPRQGAPVLVHVRDHTKFRTNVIEGVRAGGGQIADRQEAAPSIIFMRDELTSLGVTLLKSGVISVERNEAYRLDNAEAPDDITVKWFVTPITSVSELAGFVTPEDL